MSFSSLYNPKIPPLPNTEGVHPAVHYWARIVGGIVNGQPNFSSFSWSTPEGNEVAQMGTMGVNLNSAASRLWIKDSGSSTTGWFRVVYV